MQPIRCLGEDDAALGIDSVSSYLLAPVGGQAMHYDSMSRGMLEQSGIYLKALELLEPLLCFFLLPHARPHIGIDNVSTMHRFDWIMYYFTMHLGKPLPIGIHESVIKDESGGAAQSELPSQVSTTNGQRARDVVAIADEDDSAFIQRLEMLRDGEHVSQGLTRVIVI